MELTVQKQPLSAVDAPPPYHSGWPYHCRDIWDPIEARFNKCFLPIIPAVPAIIVVCILSALVLRHLLPRRPRWTEPFVKETIDTPEERQLSVKWHPSNFVVAMLFFTLVGLASQLSMMFRQPFQMSKVLATLTWMIAVLLVTIHRPKTTPFSLLVLFSCLLLSSSVLLYQGALTTLHDTTINALGLFSAFGAIAVVLLMPMRDPNITNDGISPAFEAPDSRLRSPEDALSLWQFMTVSWMSPLIALGAKRQLDDQDVWQLSHQFQHRVLHDNFGELPGSVLRRLIVANAFDLVAISILGLLDLLASAELLSEISSGGKRLSYVTGLSVPMLLQQLLRSMEDPHAPRRAAVAYAVLTLLARLILGQSSVFGLWFGRRAYERSRGEMITMLYEKMLTRKVIGLQEKQPEDGLQRDLDIRSTQISESDQDHGQEKQSASMGKVLNLMRGDVYEVAQRFWEFSTLITRPLGLIFSILLIWRVIGWPCLFGVLTVFVAQLLNALIARAVLKWERLRKEATDMKLHKISQFVEAIRHLRWYGWQDAWLHQIMEARQHELGLKVITSLWNILISFTNTLANGIFPVAAFYAYTYLAGRPLRIDIAFPALELFAILQANLRDLPGLLTAHLNAYVAVQRLQTFMAEPNKLDADVLSAMDTSLGLNHASFSWPGAASFVLRDITVTFPTGLTVVCGRVGAGKSALLQALVGELDKREGEIICPTKVFGYCAQTPWLQSMSIRDNILFSAPFDDSRYKQVITACALTEDLSNFKHGDLSNVGENGVGLSGGQKARVALARAVYSQAKILLLDDPLSALDQQTAEVVVQRCLNGSLLADRTTVLVTHRTDLCSSYARQIIEITEGRAQVLDSDGLASKSLSEISFSSPKAQTTAEEDKQQLAAIPEAFMEEEHRAKGEVKLRVYWAYIKAARYRWWLILAIVLVLYRLIEVGQSWYLKQWSEAYSQLQGLLTSFPFDRLPSPESDVRPWLIGFLLIAVAQALTFLLSRCIMVIIIYTAGRRMFRDVVKRISHATFRFYDVTPVGRLMNRLTSDIGTIDGNISDQFHNVVWLLIQWVTSVAVIASITPIFLVFSFLLAAGFALIFLRFLPTSQSLRRLEMVSLSPLLSNFGALSDGLTTIRAFCAQHRFQSRVIEVTDDFQKMDHFYWTLQAWLMYRFDLLSAVSTLILTLLALYTGVSPGLTAFVLISASKFVNSTHSLCKQYGQLQMDFVSVERVVEMLHLEQEPPGTVSPPAWWPSYDGDVVLDNVTIRYAPHLEPALNSVSFRIKAGSTTAIVGRTGSGKSTAALALLATILPESGHIFIDGIDISTVDTQSLRSRVTFLAQEPLLFPGSLRQNLDPLDQHTDAECSDVLRKVYGSSTPPKSRTDSETDNHESTHGSQKSNQQQEWPTLTTAIDTGGRNLSQGQRQLIGLARAVLRKSPIVILDEATASLDLETALYIQRVLREELKQSTLIVIAHRVEAVKEVDRFVVMGEGGRVVEVRDGEGGA